MAHEYTTRRESLALPVRLGRRRSTCVHVATVGQARTCVECEERGAAAVQPVAHVDAVACRARAQRKQQQRQQHRSAAPARPQHPVSEQARVIQPRADTTAHEALLGCTHLSFGARADEHATRRYQLSGRHHQRHRAAHALACTARALPRPCCCKAAGAQAARQRPFQTQIKRRMQRDQPRTTARNNPGAPDGGCERAHLRRSGHTKSALYRAARGTTWYVVQSRPRSMSGDVALQQGGGYGPS